MSRYPISRALQWISAIVIGFGIVLCLLYMTEFHDRNLGLMIGIGFLIGGLQILILGAAVPLMLRQAEPVSEEAAGKV